MKYGFRKVADCSNRTYFHPLFRRDQPDLLSKVPLQTHTSGFRLGLSKPRTPRYRLGRSKLHPLNHSKATAKVDPPPMSSEEKRAWETAETADVVSPGCLLVWVKATTDASAAGWANVNEDEDALYDCVPWSFLCTGLLQHVSGQLRIPSSQDTVVDDGPCEWLKERSSNMPQARVLQEKEIAFVRDVLRGYQPTVTNTEEADLISVAAFSAFSRWWSPVISTMAFLRDDWVTTDPTRVQGLIGRPSAMQWLASREPGTFLLRFSDRTDGSLEVCYSVSLH